MSHHNDNFDGGGGAETKFDPEFESVPDSFFSSGRILVTTIIMAVLLLWGGLNVVFRQWRAAYQERAAYGESVVAGAIDPLAEIVPSGEVSSIARTANSAGIGAEVAGVSSRDVNPEAWRKAVEQTHEMLVTLTAANLLDRDQMTELGASVTERVKRSKKHPETARTELAALWDEIADRAGIITEVRHVRPLVLPAKVKNVDTR